MEHVNDSSPKKELMFALVGIVMFLGIVLLIGISAYLRPAGHHVAPTVAVDDTAVETVATEDVAVAEPAMSAEESIAANTDPNDTLATTPVTDEVRSDDVVVADDMSVGGEEATTETAE